MRSKRANLKKSKMKKFNLKKCVAANVAKMSGYVPGEQPAGGGWTKLNTNEFPYPPSPKVIDAIKNEIGPDAASLRLYPNPASSKLREQIGNYFGVPTECAFAANGSDDALNLVIRAFTDDNLKVATLDPSYSLYPVLAKIQGSKLIDIPFKKNVEIDFDKIFTCGANILFFTNPNAPTGVGFPIETVEKIAQNFDGLVLVDEAYAPFADYTAAPLVEKYENLIVTGTTSKGWALAGMRVGWVIANPDIIAVLDIVRDSYNLDCLAQAAGVAALADASYYAQKCGAVISERTETERFFDSLGWKYHKSSANFIFFKPVRNGKTGAKIAKDLFEFLRENKILTRYFASEKKVSDGIRLTIGTPEQMKEFKKAAMKWAGKK